VEARHREHHHGAEHEQGRELYRGRLRDIKEARGGWGTSSARGRAQVHGGGRRSRTRPRAQTATTPSTPSR